MPLIAPDCLEQVETEMAEATERQVADARAAATTELEALHKEYLEKLAGLEAAMEAMRASHVAALAEAATGEPHEVMLLKLEVEDLKKTVVRLTPSREAATG